MLKELGKRLKRFFHSTTHIWLFSALTLNLTVYNCTRIFNKNLYHYDMTVDADAVFPLLPWTIIIYLGCYLFWVANYACACLQDDAREAKKFLISEISAKVVCCICFLAIPTTMTRPEVPGSDFWSAATRWLYDFDPADNLFPSIHCLTSWFCVIAVRKLKGIPLWYKLLSVLMALAVCLSTLTMKQHVLADVFSGVFLAEGSYQITRLIFKLRSRSKKSGETTRS